VFVLLVGIVTAVVIPVAFEEVRNAAVVGLATEPTFWACRVLALVSGFLVGHVSAIVIVIALPISVDAFPVVTTELVWFAG